MAIKHYIQGKDTDAELFLSITKWAISEEVHEQIGMPVTARDGDLWLVNIKNGKPVGFSQIRPMKNGNAHLRYLHSDSLTYKLELGRAAEEKSKEIGATCLYTNEREGSEVLTSLGFKMVKHHKNSRFARWERTI